MVATYMYRYTWGYRGTSGVRSPAYLRRPATLHGTRCQVQPKGTSHPGSISRKYGQMQPRAKSRAHARPKRRSVPEMLASSARFRQRLARRTTSRSFQQTPP